MKQPNNLQHLLKCAV